MWKWKTIEGKQVPEQSHKKKLLEWKAGGNEVEDKVASTLRLESIFEEGFSGGLKRQETLMLIIFFCYLYSAMMGTGFLFLASAKYSTVCVCFPSFQTIQSIRVISSIYFHI
jgi:hypothetical protein